MFANRSDVRNEITDAKKLTRIEASSICRQQIVNVFSDCLVLFMFANTRLPTIVCRVKAA